MSFRPQIILLVIVILLTLSSQVSAAASNEIASTSNAWESYKKNPNSHPNIPNNSYAGFRYGEQSIPEIPIKVKASEYGAVGDGKTDSTNAINNALKAASDKGGGAVVLDEGTYIISDIILMKYSGVVLRGSGTGKTVLKCTKPLQDIFPDTKMSEEDKQDEELSFWYNKGGIIWFAPYEKDHLFQHDEGKDIYSIQEWQDASTVAKITSSSKRGDFSIKVDNVSKLSAGQKVLLHYMRTDDYSQLKTIAGNLPGVESFDWAKKASGLNKKIMWPVEITAVNGNTVTLKQPLRIDVKADWNCVLRKIPVKVENSGVESLTIDMEQPQSYKWKHGNEWGYNGIYYQSAWDCWAKDIVIRDAEVASCIGPSKCITEQDIVLDGQCYHHGFVNAGFDSLVTRFKIYPKVFHGLGMKGLGNVFSEGVMEHGALDYHRLISTEWIVTDLTINNDGVHGSQHSSVPLYGARVAHWNINITNNRPYVIYAPNLMPLGAVVGVTGCSDVYSEEKPDFTGDLMCIEEASGKNGKRVEPANLHLAQLKLRIDTSTSIVPAGKKVNSDTIKVCIDGKYIDFTNGVAPTVIDGTTLVPFRAIFEALGAKVSWDDRTSTARGIKGDITVRLPINKKKAYVNERAVSLGVPAMLIDSTTMVPARFVAESLGYEVQWDSTNNTVVITSK